MPADSQDALGARPAWQAYDLRTNIEQRAFVLGMLHAGADRADAAEALGQTYQNAWQITSRPRPERVRTLTSLLDSQRPARKTCAKCGHQFACGSLGYDAQHCRKCFREMKEQVKRERVEALFAHARKTGVVPSARRAGQILGLGHSTAGEIVYQAFGPDQRPQKERATQPRLYREATSA